MPSSFSALIGTSQRSDFLSKALLVLAGTAVLALAAHVKVPFWPVPMTMQTLVVLLIGAAYGPTLAAATLITYLVEGALGLPVFTSGAGALYMVGLTGGYLVASSPPPPLSASCSAAVTPNHFPRRSPFSCSVTFSSSPSASHGLAI